MMKLKLEKYEQQKINWPEDGKHVLAQYNDEHVVVYQSYRPAIGLFAAENQYFGGEYSYSRMSWIKPNFLWMMYRSGWSTKPGQEIALAIYLKREYFESILLNAIPSTNLTGIDQAEWKKQLARSDVRLQWDPDHNPYGHKMFRRAVQLGLRNDFLLPFKGEGIIRIENISNFVAEQYELVKSGDLEFLMTPSERVYPLSGKAKQALCIEQDDLSLQGK